VRILLTNDDGITAPGLIALYRAIADLGEVRVVAPATVQSAMSHSVTFHQVIATRRHVVSCETGVEVFEGVAVEGRPADCVKLAIAQLLEDPVDLVISGMNAGANVGINVIYSGTVAAAMEAAFIGIPAIAVSLHIGDPHKTRWDAAAGHARHVIERILRGPLQPHTVLNVNVPILDDGAEPRGVRVVPISTSPIIDAYEPSEHPNGDRHFRAGSGMNFRHTPPDTDVDALFKKYITLTALHFNLTQHEQTQIWREFMQE